MSFVLNAATSPAVATEAWGRPMTEAEWLTATSPQPMLEFLNGKAHDRKSRLFACACVRRVWHLLRDDRSKAAVEVGERFADGQATEDERLVACDKAEQAFLAIGPGSEDGVDYWNAATSAQTVNYALAYFAAEGASKEVRAAVNNSPKLTGIPHDSEDRAHAALLREIFGNPFRPITLDPAWLIANVLSLAREVYGSRDFSQMPILAGALQDAGCDNAVVLAHCRGPGPHVRGCWVVDLVLGRSE